MPPDHAAIAHPFTTGSPRVIVGASYWALNGVNVFSMNLVRGLRRRGFDAHVLMTEEHSALIRIDDAAMPRPDDVPFVELPVGRWRSWGAHWGAMIRYLEDRAPCVYIPNADWRHSSVTPLLSDEVRVVGVVHSDDPLHYDHVKRLGAYWDAVVTTSGTIAAKTIALDPDLRDRTTVIPIGVEIPATLTVRHRRRDEPLRVIYPGSLKQHQKRVLDLPAIVAAAARRGLPLTLTIAGGGPDEDRLRRECEPLVARGLITFLGVVEHSRVLTLLEEHDVFIMTSAFEGMPNALLEAMGRGCVSIVTDMESAVPDLVRDDDNGYVVPIGGIEAFVDRLSALCSDAGAWDRMSRRAYETVSAGKFRVEDMVGAYEDLCTRLLGSGPRSYQRPLGVLAHPPREVEGVGLFPVDLTYEAPGVGSFPDEVRDYREFTDEIRQLRDPDASRLGWLARQARTAQPDLSCLDGVPVIVSAGVWTGDGVNEFSVDLVRELRRRGLDAHILLTEEHTQLVNLTAPRVPMPVDVPFTHLPIAQQASWGGHWGAMIRYLEERAPCIYMPSQDWRHSCVCPVLSDRVAVVGVVHGDDPLHLDHVRRLGAYWNAAVAHDTEVARAIQQLNPPLAPRLHVVPRGIRLPDTAPARSATAGASLQVVCLVQGTRSERALVSGIRSALGRLGTPVGFTIVRPAGTVPDPAVSRWAARVGLRLLDAPGEDERLRVFGLNDVVLILDGFADQWQFALEAIGAGCVPVAVHAGEAPTAWGGLIEDNHSGYLVTTQRPRQRPREIADRLTRLCHNPSDRARMAQNAFDLAKTSSIDFSDMAQAWVEVLARAVTGVRTGAYRRPGGPLSHPPPRIGENQIYTIGLDYAVPGVGQFPARTPDYREFVEAIGPAAAPALRAVARSPEDVEVRQRVHGAALKQMEVVIALPAWVEGGVAPFAVQLARQLTTAGMSAHILLTEEDTARVRSAPSRLARPADVRFVRLPVGHEGSWGAHWGAMVRYLEERGPCIYIPNDDWRHSCVCPLLSDQVLVVGVVHDAGPLHRDHVARLGRYWNAIVAHDAAVGEPMIADPTLAARVTVLPYAPEDLGLDYLRVFDRAIEARETGAYHRPKGVLEPPPREIGTIQIMPIDFSFRQEGVGLFPQRDPDYVEFEQHLGPTPAARD